MEQTLIGDSSELQVTGVMGFRVQGLVGLGLRVPVIGVMIRHILRVYQGNTRTLTPEPGYMRVI